MFKNFKWYDWVIGLFTYGIWILYKLHKNGVPIGKVIGGGVIVIVSIGIIGSLLQTDEDKAKYYIKNEDLTSLKSIVDENPNIEVAGKKISLIYDSMVKQKAQQEKLAKLKAEAEAERIAKEKADRLAIAKSKGYNSYEDYQKGEAEAIAKAERLAKEKAEADRLAKERAERTTIVSRDELNRVLSKPHKYLGKIIHFKDKVDWDYVLQFSIIDLGDSKHKFFTIDKFDAKGANWKTNRSATAHIPQDIYNKMDDDFYNKSGRNINDVYMQSNEIELLPITGKEYQRIFGSGTSSKYIGKDETVLLVTKIKIYNRSLGTYQTKMINY